jgi:MFS transporter, YNFM family, putative membrane transport protein
LHHFVKVKAMVAVSPSAAPARAADFTRLVVVGLIGFLTLVDLFATQAILPTLTRFYRETPAATGLAVNAGTVGMAVAGLLVALFSHRAPRRDGIWISLAILALPTTLLAFAPSLVAFAALRVVQGVFMSAAFTLTMTYLAEESSAEQTASVLAAYVTGVVASNLVGRLVASPVADQFGLAVNFYVFAALNLAGAALVWFSLKRTAPMASDATARLSTRARLAAHWNNRCLRASFGIGFCILFAFIGAFTYVNFVLARSPLALSPMGLGLVYFVFAPSMVTTPLAGRVANRFGPRPTFWASLGLAGAGLPLVLAPALAPVLLGLVLIGVGTFFAQATATGFVGRAAKSDRAAASGLYLASYYMGGLAGAALLGQVFEKLGWPATVAGVGLALMAAALLAAMLRPATAGAPAPRLAR